MKAAVSPRLTLRKRLLGEIPQPSLKWYRTMNEPAVVRLQRYDKEENR